MTTKLRLILAVLAFSTAGAQTAVAPQKEYALVVPMSVLQQHANLAEMQMMISYFSGDRDNAIWFQGQRDAYLDQIALLKASIP